MLRKTVFLLFVALLLTMPVYAQDSTEEAGTVPAMELPPLPGEPIAVGLDHPRQFFFAPDGTLWIAEVGLGGDVPVETPEGPGTFGMSGEITFMTAGGEPTTAMGNLPSAGDGGVQAVVATDEAIYAIVGGMLPNIPMSSSLLILNPENYRLIDYVDFFTYEATNNPDGNEIDTNVTDLALGDDGTLYIVDAGGNTLYSWTQESGLTVIKTWPENTVPDGMDIGPDGNFYISHLSPAPFLPGTSFIEVISPDGETVATYPGLTMATDVAVMDDGTIYAVELSGGPSEGGFRPGRVVQVSADGVTPIAEALMFPYGITVTPDGGIAISVVSAFVPVPGSGAIVRLPLE